MFQMIYQLLLKTLKVIFIFFTIDKIIKKKEKDSLFKEQTEIIINKKGHKEIDGLFYVPIFNLSLFDSNEYIIYKNCRLSKI